MAQQLALRGLRAFASEVVLPLAEAVGDMWALGKLPIAGEHMASEVVLHALKGGLRMIAGIGPLLVAGCLPGERHEWGVLATLAIVAGGGWRVHYLGADLPVEEVVEASLEAVAGRRRAEQQRPGPRPRLPARARRPPRQAAAPHHARRSAARAWRPTRGCCTATDSASASGRFTRRSTVATSARARPVRPAASSTGDAARTRHVLVIGAGLGGLAAAVRLRHRGFRVTVLERHARPGGRCGALGVRGFRFDTGPTLLLMTDYLRAVFRDAGRDMDDYLELRQLDPNYRVQYADGTTLDVTSRLNAMLEGVERMEPGRDAAVPPLPLRDLPALPDRPRRLRGPERPPAGRFLQSAERRAPAPRARDGAAPADGGALLPQREAASHLQLSVALSRVSRRSSHPPSTACCRSPRWPAGSTSRWAGCMRFRARWRGSPRSSVLPSSTGPTWRGWSGRTAGYCGGPGRRAPGPRRPRAGQRRPAVRLRDAAGRALPRIDRFDFSCSGVPHVPGARPAVSRAAHHTLVVPGGPARRTCEDIFGRHGSPRTRRTISAIRARPIRASRRRAARISTCWCRCRARRRAARSTGRWRAPGSRRTCSRGSSGSA